MSTKEHSSRDGNPGRLAAEVATGTGRSQVAEGLRERVSVVLAPREKHSTLPGSLRSLFTTIPASVPVIACLPKLPPEVLEPVATMMDARGCSELHEYEPDLIPHRARVLGAERVRTPWVVFADNDLHYEPGWLHALTDAMERRTCDVLAPLIFIGPPSGAKIHHAGGLLTVSEQPGGRIHVREKHRLMNRRVDETGVRQLLNSEDFALCDVAEFHCLALRTELLGNRISLPEELITREQQDLALQCKRNGLKVGFVPDAGVTYMARSEFTDNDLRYHAARWSEARASRSLDYMESKWNMDFDRERVLYKWIEMHRRRPFKARGPALLKTLPSKALGLYLRRRYGYEV